MANIDRARDSIIPQPLYKSVESVIQNEQHLGHSAILMAIFATSSANPR